MSQSTESETLQNLELPDDRNEKEGFIHSLSTASTQVIIPALDVQGEGKDKTHSICLKEPATLKTPVKL